MELKLEPIYHTNVTIGGCQKLESKLSDVAS